MTIHSADPGETKYIVRDGDPFVTVVSGDPDMWAELEAIPEVVEVPTGAGYGEYHLPRDVFVSKVAGDSLLADLLCGDEDGTA